MAKHVSQMPSWFISEKERFYWHMAQDIAWRAGVAMVLRNGEVWLVNDEGERLICDAKDPEWIWFETWRALRAEFPEHVRLWVKGRPITTPGELT